MKRITAPYRAIPIEPLTQETFAPFGDVVENPVGSVTEPRSIELPSNAVLANQGSAVKLVNVSRVTNHYNRAPSGIQAQPVMNMFISSPRRLRVSGSPKEYAGLNRLSYSSVLSSSGKGAAQLHLDVSILERHPFTSQTFAPLGFGPHDDSRCFLVIIAASVPSVSQSQSADAWAEEFATARLPETASAEPIAPINPPDLAPNAIRAFVAHGGQAVTYAAGTWHAPMVVLGSESVAFVVTQFANGVANEDCQEVELVPVEGDKGLRVELKLPLREQTQSSKL